MKLDQVTLKIGPWSPKSITCYPHSNDVSYFIIKVFYPFQLYNQPSLVWILEIGGRQAFGQTWPSDLEIGPWSPKSITCYPHPNDVSNFNQVFYPFQLYNQPSLVWICEIGGRQAFAQTWPSDLEIGPWSPKSITCFPHPYDVLKFNQVIQIIQSTKFGLNSCDRGQISILSNGDLENRVMVTKINLPHPNDVSIWVWL